MTQLNIPNLDRLISHLEGLPEAQFNMGQTIEETECGTVACIGGWSLVLLGDYYGSPSEFLGLDGASDAAGDLYMPAGWQADRCGARQYTLSRAIRTLKHMRSEYLRTGQVDVDWDAPEPVTKAAWATPRAVEQRKLALPAEIVRFLRPADHEVVS